MLGQEARPEAHSLYSGGRDETSSAGIADAACIGCGVFALGRVPTAASASGQSAVLERLPEIPLTKELIAAFWEAAEIATGG